MTLIYAKAGVEMSRCAICDHDLHVPGKKGLQTTGDVHCSNRKCAHFKKPYPMGSSPNEGKVAA